MKIRVEFNIELPSWIQHTDKELIDYLRYYYGINNKLSLDNPFEQWRSGMPERVSNLSYQKVED